MTINPQLSEINSSLYRVAVKAIIIQDGKVLLVQDNRDTAWTLPGGGVDYGETPEQAMKRELSEEIGITQDQIEQITPHPTVILGQIKSGVPRCNLHFVVQLQTNAQLKPTQEVQKLDWIAVDQLHTQDFDATAGPKDQVLSLFTSV